jgi:uncharacterized protein (TIGR02246 family)
MGAVVLAGIVASSFAGPRAAAQQAPRGGKAPASATEPAADPARVAEAQAIQALDSAFQQAFDRGDARAMAALFTEDAELTAEDESSVHGRAAIEAHFAAAFAARPGERIELETRAITFLAPEVARAQGLSRTIPADAKARPETTVYDLLLVKRGKAWLHAAVHEATAEPLTPHERLAELSWMVGEWIDESEQGTVRTSCKWSDDGNFLLREFHLEGSGRLIPSGTQRIGWDPRTGQFRSWVFDTDGGYSEGLWSRDGENRWVIHASGVLADGRGVAATQILTRERDDLARWRSVDRSVGGEAIADLPEVVLVRKPPAPGERAGN